jgi:hypothetical protein
MRKTALFALLLAAVLLLAGRSEASVVESAYGPTIYTWSDSTLTVKAGFRLHQLLKTQ